MKIDAYCCVDFCLFLCMLNDNIIEKVTDFKYLVYRISEYKSDLEDTLQTYNKINGAIIRHFGKKLIKK